MVPLKEKLSGDFGMETYILSQALDYANKGIMIQDTDRKIVFFNRACEKITKLTRDKVIGKDCGDIFKCHTSTGLCITEKCCPGTDIIQGKLSGGSRELFMNRGDGGECWVRVNIAPMKDNTGKITHIISVIEDISEIKKYSGEILKSKTLSSLGTLASELAHEVKNPLNAMNVQLLVLKHEIEDASQPNEEQKKELLKIISTVQNEIDRLGGFVEECLRFSKTGELSKSDVDICKLLEELFTLLRPQAQLNGIHMELNTQGDIPPVKLDRDRIKQAIMNILINSIEAMPDGGDLRISVHSRKEEIYIYCHDSGPGISDELKDKIFNLFYTTKNEGTGIGLSSALNIIQAHGGTIRLAPSAVGTKFLITIPANRD